MNVREIVKSAISLAKTRTKVASVVASVVRRAKARSLVKSAARDWEGMWIDDPRRLAKERAEAKRTGESRLNEFKYNMKRNRQELEDTLRDIQENWHRFGVKTVGNLGRGVAALQYPKKYFEEGSFSGAAGRVADDFKRISDWEKSQFGAYGHDEIGSHPFNKFWLEAGPAAAAAIPAGLAAEEAAATPAYQAAKPLIGEYIKPGSLLRSSSSKTLQTLGKIYGTALPLVQGWGALAEGAFDPEDVSKLPRWVRAIPATSRWLSPKGTIMALGARALGEYIGTRPKKALSTGSFVSQILKNEYENLIKEKNVPVLPEASEWPTSARENFTEGFKDGITRNNPHIESAITDYVTNTMERAVQQLPESMQDVARTTLDYPQVAKDLETFYKSPYTTKKETIKKIPEIAAGWGNKKIDDIKNKLPEIWEKTWGDMTPDERELAARAAAQLSLTGQVVADDINDIGVILGPDDDVDVGKLALRIGKRTIPIAITDAMTIRDIAKAVRARKSSGGTVISR